MGGQLSREADQNVAVEGQIEGIQFKNPHVLITIRSVDSTIYTAEWKTVRALRATEVTNDTLKIRMLRNGLIVAIESLRNRHL
jgi:hypothetical protein